MAVATAGFARFKPRLTSADYDKWTVLDKLARSATAEWRKDQLGWACKRKQPRHDDALTNGEYLLLLGTKNVGIVN